MALTSHEIREHFLSYFEKQNHKRFRSSSLVPVDDPTLLFTNAGMNQFKDIFTGLKERPVPCATTSQKCVRAGGKHNDLENVGLTARHQTFFEMLGNFSFGDYFKREAIRFAWEFSTQIIKFPEDKIWVTVFREDDEAYDLWRKEIGIAENRIVRMDEKDNFWAMGDTGPCGPCSELHYDQGDGPNGIWKNDDIYSESDRFLEFWNLVFMQFERKESGEMLPLPKPSIDTGAGLERLVALSQGKFNNYDTDLFTPIIHAAAQACGKRYGEDRGTDTSLRVIADHARAAAFLVADGILPSNEGRGYVLRRIMRRAIRHGKLLGFETQFYADACDTVIGHMQDVYPELSQNRDFVLKVVNEEEKSFRRTLSTGMDILDEAVETMKAKGENKLSGEVVFKLYDTYGFPTDLTRLMVEEQGLSLDEAGFEKEMEAQRARGRASWKGSFGGEREQLYAKAVQQSGPCEFSGYDHEEENSATLKAIVGPESLQDEAIAGQDVELQFNRSPFYAESGGQVGDTGLVVSQDLNLNDEQRSQLLTSNKVPEGLSGTVALVHDCVKPIDGAWLHKARVLQGKVETGASYRLIVNGQRRSAIRSNHSATHLLQRALRHTLGDHVKQAGSFVGPDRLRFDFNHFQGVTPQEIRTIERHVNHAVRKDSPVCTEVKDLDSAVADGAMAFFGEKYGDTVRVVSMGESMELCGGTHVARTGEIGTFVLVAEGSIASGVRRVEALTGEAALRWIQEQLDATNEAGKLLSVVPDKVAEGVRSLHDQLKKERKQIEQLQKEIGRLQGGSLLETAKEIKGVKFLAAKVDQEGKALRDFAQEMLDKLQHGVLCLAFEQKGKLGLLVGVTKDLSKTMKAGKLVGEAASLAGGRGGGKPEMAQAGGCDPEKMQAMFDKVESLLADM